MIRTIRLVAIWVVVGLCAYFAYTYFFADSAPDAGRVDWSNDGPALVYNLIWLAVLIPIFFVMRPKLSDVAKGVLLWGGLGVLLVAGYAYRADLEEMAAPVLSALVPGYAFQSGMDEVVLTRSGDGHFRANARINGVSADVLVDTGASTVTLTYETALAAGYDPASLPFRTPVSTANGIAMAAPVRLESVAIGPLVFDEVEALVAERGRLSSNLLGLSFLSRLESYAVRGDRMTMTQ
ncbi:MAG: TIGR02281 family clan AA aspartic protease [Pseudomonadota bacterium]